jgi:hypothetical protein
MYLELEDIIHQAEEKYLQDENLEVFSSHISSLRERMETYELIREGELEVFQAVANRLLEKFPKEKPVKIEQSLKHWLLITRYCAMAMLLNNPEFLQRRLLEWLTDIVKAHDLQVIENNLVNILLQELRGKLSEKQVGYFKPFVEQAKITLFDSETFAQ